MTITDVVKDTQLKTMNMVHRTLLCVSGGRIGARLGDMQVFKVVVSPDDTVFATLEWQQDRTDAGLLRLWCLGAR